MVEVGMILAIAVGVYLLVTYVTYTQTRALEKTSLRPAPTAKPPGPSNEWAVANGFVFIGGFTMKIGAQNWWISTWQRPDRPTFFCEYVIQFAKQSKTVFDLVTMFASDVGLTTGGTADGHLFPNRKGSYMQTFSNSRLSEQWDRHIEMENYLMDVGGVQLIHEDKGFEELFLAAIAKQCRYVRNLTFWPFRGAYWFFVRRWLWHNKTIKAQHDKGIVLVQRELDKSTLRLRDFFCLRQILNPPLAGLFYQVFSGITKR